MRGNPMPDPKEYRMTLENSDARIQQLEDKVRILSRLTEVSAALNSTLELEALLIQLMDAATEITDSEGASVLLWDDQVRELRFAATTSNQADLQLIGTTVPLEGSIAGTILLEKRVVQVDDTTNDPRHYSKLDEDKHFETRSLLGVPMTSKSNTIGVLEAVNKKGLPWSPDDRDYLSVLAAQAAVAIERAQLVSALKKANQELSELDKLKNDFISIASHELRTPLSIILGYASFLQEESEGKMNEHAQKVLASGLQLRHIIEDLMNLRYLQQSAAELNRENVTIEEIVDDAVQDILSMAEAKGHKITINTPRDTHLHVDRIRTVMALTNILNNAVRFTPENGVITVEADLHNRDEAWITVTDTGIGLKEDQLERIFEKFYQVEEHMTRVHGGLGIGLSIARALVEAHGGRIWATSPGLGKGTTLTLTLPLAEVSE
jgi:signal transduction histidine kinase